MKKKEKNIRKNYKEKKNQGEKTEKSSPPEIKIR